MLLAGVALLIACTFSPGPARTTSLSSTTSTTVKQVHEEETAVGPARATLALEPPERSRLGLPATTSGIHPAELPPLGEAEWADPAVVAARFALIRTNYTAAEDPAVLKARSDPYLVPRLQEDLASSSGGGTVLGELQAKNAVFSGNVLGLVTSERSAERAVVELTARRSVVGDDGLNPERVVFWRVTLVRDAATGHWLVVDLQQW